MVRGKQAVLGGGRRSEDGGRRTVGPAAVRVVPISALYPYRIREIRGKIRPDRAPPDLTTEYTDFHGWGCRAAVALVFQPARGDTEITRRRRSEDGRGAPGPELTESFFKIIRLGRGRGLQPSPH